MIRLRPVNAREPDDADPTHGPRSDAAKRVDAGIFARVHSMWCASGALRRAQRYEPPRWDYALLEELLVGVLVAYEPDGLGQVEGGLQQPADHELGDDIRDAHVEPEGLPARSSLDGVHHLATEGEYLVRVAEHHLTGLGERQLAADLAEELLAELVLERMDLRAQRRVGEPQDLARTDEPSFASDHPEIEQMVVVDPFHGSQRCVAELDMSRRYFVKVNIIPGP